MNEHWMGFPRSNGQVGVRNLVAVIPSCGCALHAASLIAAQVPGAAVLSYTGGCSETEVDTENATRLLAQFGRHPNVIGSIVVGLGCEMLSYTDLANRIAAGPSPVELLVVQQLGGTRRTVEKGVSLARHMLAPYREATRQPCPVSALTVGLECGGSDATSGLAANPAVGALSDMVVARGGKVILAETSELLGAEHVLRERSASPEITERLMQTIAECERYLKATGEDFFGKQPTPGNVRGGLTTVEEKALGDARKGGTSPIVDVLAYGEPPKRPGLSFMDTPGNDLASVTGLVSAGCQLVVFTTGRGNPMGNAIAPVIKVTGNEHTYAMMGEDIDLDASPIIRGEETWEQTGARIFDLALRVASGEPTAAEVYGHAEFVLVRQGPIY